MDIQNNQVISFFINHTNYQKDNILSCDLFYEGYTNTSYLIKIKNKAEKYIVKFFKNTIDTLVNEVNFFKLYFKEALIYHDDKNFIFKWFDHYDLNIKDSNNLNIMEKIFKEIKKFNNLKINFTLTEFDYFSFSHIQQKKKLMFLVYKNILNKYLHFPKVVSHGDVNFKNILYLKKDYEIKLIDYEWARYNYAWFDYINFISEDCVFNHEILNLLRKYLNINLSENDVYELMFVKWFFSWAWAKANNNLKDMKIYQKKAWKQTKNYFKYLKQIIDENKS